MAELNGNVPMSGDVSMKLRRNLGTLQPATAQQPKGLMQFIKNAFFPAPHINTEFNGKLKSYIVFEPSLSGVVFRPNLNLLSLEQVRRMRELLALNVDVRELASPFRATIEDRGVLSYRVVTDAGVAYLANNFASSGALIANFKFHGFGTGTANEGVAQTALQTELTTQYAVDSTRPTGSQASAAAVYTTIATLSPDSGGTLAITEHGIFSAASAGTLWDRSVFAAVNLVAGSDSLQVTYNLTLTSGG